ncbi:MAG TPA: aminomethyl-transferring glycine dehydrogenase subunit GcvPA [Verrucomicrobiae bacterium]|nr:aminomethyl-transferring glycine dehydrogenase subunit GcvPA [Verrucomicrobiae bacterium]
MRYLPKSPSERGEMLSAIGVASIEELFESIPAEFRLSRPLRLPGPLSEAEIIQYFQARAAENSRGFTSFLGAGVYPHLRSVVADSLIQRGEFLTSYTPYQAEFAQGTLTAIFEFQTLMCQLTGQEVANASMYDGSTALTEAILMAHRLTGRNQVLMARSVHPQYRQVFATYARNLGIAIEEVGYTSSGQIDLGSLPPEKIRTAAAIVVQSPNFFGVLENVPGAADSAHAAESLLVVTVAEALSLGVARPPAEADIVAMEGQSLGVAPSYGGPYVGVVATRERFVRQMPGRLAGQTTDEDGNRGFVLTLATREQHIRRERATSNICTNEALFALAATIHLCLLGRRGIRELAAQNLAKARYALGELEKIPGVLRSFSGPFFNEFAVDFPRAVKLVNASLLREKIIGPCVLGAHYPELTKRGLVCVTETTPRAEIDRFVAAVRKILENPV